MPSLRKTVVDHTILKPGTKVGEYAIEICEACKKPGLAITHYQRTAVLHTISFVFNDDGTFEIADEVHLTPLRSPEASNPK